MGEISGLFDQNEKMRGSLPAAVSRRERLRPLNQDHQKYKQPQSDIKLFLLDFYIGKFSYSSFIYIIRTKTPSVRSMMPRMPYNTDWD